MIPLSLLALLALYVAARLVYLIARATSLTSTYSHTAAAPMQPACVSQDMRAACHFHLASLRVRKVSMS
jgi:hypothetical protein